MFKKLIKRSQEIEARLNAIADTAEAEKRSLTDEENAEVESLQREATVIKLRMQADGMHVNVEKNNAQMFAEVLRERMAHNGIVEFDVREERAVTTSTSNIDGMTPVTIGDLIEPLEEGLIYHKLGIKIEGGLVGSFIWPVMGAFEASVGSEAVALSDATISLDKVTPSPKRLGVTATISMQAINRTAGKVYNAVVKQLPKAVARLINKIIFADAAVSGISGPLVYCFTQTATAISSLTTAALQKACYNIAFAAALPTYKELVAMKGCVMARGVENDGSACYVMDEYTKALLESTPRESGDARMIIEDGKINGYPVFCTNHIDSATHSGVVAFGIWSYCALGQFGDQRLVIDTLSGAKADAAYLTLNADWAVSILRQQAFCVGYYTAPTPEEI